MSRKTTQTIGKTLQGIQRGFLLAQHGTAPQDLACFSQLFLFCYPLYVEGLRRSVPQEVSCTGFRSCQAKVEAASMVGSKIDEKAIDFYSLLYPVL